MKIHKTLRWHRKKLLTRFSSQRTSVEQQQRRLYRQTRTVHHFVHEFLLPVFRSLQGDVHKQVTIIMLFVLDPFSQTRTAMRPKKKGIICRRRRFSSEAGEREKNVKIEKDFNKSERENFVVIFITLLHCR